MAENQHGKMMRTARTRVAAMDKIDGSSVAEQGIWQGVRTIMTALDTAIKTGDWAIACDAQVMLSQVELRLRPADYKDRGVYLEEK